MSSTSSRINQLPDIMETSYADVTTAADNLEEAQLKLTAAEGTATTFSRIATLSYTACALKNEYEIALFVSDLELYGNLPAYIQQAAALALQEGTEINL